MRICVYGAASPTIDKKYIKETEKLGEFLAERGHSLIFGAGGNGLMGAVARGFKNNNGNVVGIIPKFFKNESVELIFERCDELIFTETMRERKQTMENYSEAFIVVPGGIGTFEEFFEILTLKQLRRHSKPIALYNINGYFSELNLAIESAVKKNFITEACKNLYFISDNLNDIIEYIENSNRVNFSKEILKKG